MKKKLGNKLFFWAGILACISWSVMSAGHSSVFLCLSLAGFGFGFIMIQPTLVSTAQQLLPKRRGTSMSLASFAMFTGGGIGAYLNGRILTVWGFETIFIFAGLLILVTGIFTTALLQRMAQSVSIKSRIKPAMASSILKADRG